MSDPKGILDKPLPVWARIPVAIFIGVFLVGGTIFTLSKITSVFSHLGSSNAPASVPTHDDVEAYVQAEYIVQNYLKAPSTAKFPSMSQAKIEHLAEDAFRIDSYVDSQNSFGAMLRSDWTVLFQFVGGKVEISAVVIDGEVLYKKDAQL